MGFTPRWAPWLTAVYQLSCREARPADVYQAFGHGALRYAPDYYRIMAALRAKTQGEGECAVTVPGASDA